MMVHTGFFIAAFARWAKGRDADPAAPDDHKITLDGHQGEGLFGVHQARLQLAGDPTTYRLIIAPASAPIMINGRPVEQCFALPLGDR